MFLHIFEIAPREFVVTVFGLAENGAAVEENSTKVRMATVETATEAIERKGYLIMSLPTHLRPRT